MDGVASTLRLSIEIRHGLERGESVLITIKRNLTDWDQELSQQLRNLILAIEQPASLSEPQVKIKSPYRKALLQLIHAAISGESILSRLIEVENEIKNACDQDIDRYITQLPLKIMMPVLLLQFPAFLILLLGPILSKYITELSV